MQLYDVQCNEMQQCAHAMELRPYKMGGAPA